MSTHGPSTGSGQADPNAQAAEYALGLLPDAERPAFEARLAEDAVLRAEVAAWNEHLASLALAEIDEIAPSPQLRKRLESQLFQSDRTPFWQQIWPYALGGVAAALVSWAVLTSGLLVSDPPLRPDLQAVMTPTPDGGALQLTASVDLAAGQVQIEQIAGTQPDGRVLELWVIIADAAPLSLGLLDEGGRTRLGLPAPVLAQLDGATLAISDEPPGGSPTGAPTGTVRAAGALTSS